MSLLQRTTFNTKRYKSRSEMRRIYVIVLHSLIYLSCLKVVNQTGMSVFGSQARFFINFIMHLT